MRALGIILILVGVIALAIQGFSYTEKDEVLDVGPLEATVEEEKDVRISPVIGAVALVAGVVLLATSRRRL